MPGASGLSKREVLEPLAAELRRLRPDADAPEFFDWRARTNEAMRKLFGPRHRLTVSFRDVTFTPDFAQGRARALALLRTAGALDNPTHASSSEASSVADDDPGRPPATAHEETPATSMPEPVAQPAVETEPPEADGSGDRDGTLEETAPTIPADSPAAAGAIAPSPDRTVVADVEAPPPSTARTGKHAPLVERALPDWPDWTDWPDELPGEEPARATSIDSVLPAWPDWVGWPETVARQDELVHTNEAGEQLVPDDNGQASAGQADEEDSATKTSLAGDETEETSSPVAIDTAVTPSRGVASAPIHESAAASRPECTDRPDVRDPVSALETALPGSGTEAETESEGRRFFHRLIRRRTGLRASPSATGEPAGPVKGESDEALHVEAGETSGDGANAGETPATALPAEAALPAESAPSAEPAPSTGSEPSTGLALPGESVTESAVPCAAPLVKDADELVPCAADASPELGPVVPSAAEEPAAATGVPAVQVPPTTTMQDAPTPPVSQEQKATTLSAAQESPTVPAHGATGSGPSPTGGRPDEARSSGSPRGVGVVAPCGSGVEVPRRIGPANASGASEGRIAFGARPAGASTWEVPARGGVSIKGVAPGVREATTKPFLTEPGTISREFTAFEIGRRIGRTLDTSDLVPVAPHPANWAKQKGTGRSGRRLKRLLLAAVITVFLALAVTFPVRASWIEGWSTILGLVSDDVTSTTATPSALGPSANAHVVDVAGDPRSVYILQMVRAGIIRFQPNEKGEVSFFPAKLVTRGEFLVWLDRVRPIPRGNGEEPAGLFYDLDPILRGLAGAAYQRRIVLAWPRDNAQIAFKASDPILVRDAEAWAARMIVGLLPGTALQHRLGVTETDALDLRTRISSLSARELTMVVEAFGLRPEGGWAKEESLSRSEAAEFLVNLKAVFDAHRQL